MNIDIEQIRQAISRTQVARQRVLQHRSTDTIIAALAQAAKNWLDPKDPWRLRAIEQAPAATGFSSAMVSEAIGLTFAAITKEGLGELLDGELGDRRVLDGCVPKPERFSSNAPAPHPDPLPASGERGTPPAEDEYQMVRRHERVKRDPFSPSDGEKFRMRGSDNWIVAAKQAAGTAASTNVARRALGPGVIAHFLAGNVPAPGIVSICCGLLLKSANLVKVSKRDSLFPTLFVESLRAVDAELADCVAVLDWRREEVTLTQAALAEADAVIAYGDDETVETLRRMCQPEARFIGYGHKLSFAVVGREALKQEALTSLAEAAAFDVSVYDQQGCLSPHVFYVEEGGDVAPRDFAAALATAMAAYQLRVPRGQLTVEEAAQIARLRGAYEFRSASDKSVAVWAHTPGTTNHMNGGVGLRACPDTSAQAGTPVPPRLYGMGSVGWLVVYEEDPMFTPSCLNRVVFVKPVERLEKIRELVRRFAPNLSTVGIALLNERALSFANALAELGISRVCAIGRMQRPPLTWHHDGRPNLADLVRWVEVG